MKCVMGCSRLSGTRQRPWRSQAPLRVARARAAAEQAAARAPAHQGGSQWTTSSASFPTTDSRSLLRAEAPQVSVAAGSVASALRGSIQGTLVPRPLAHSGCIIMVAALMGSKSALSFRRDPYTGQAAPFCKLYRSSRARSCIRRCSTGLSNCGSGNLMRRAACAVQQMQLRSTALRLLMAFIGGQGQSLYAVQAFVRHARECYR